LKSEYFFFVFFKVFFFEKENVLFRTLHKKKNMQKFLNSALRKRREGAGIHFRVIDLASLKQNVFLSGNFEPQKNHSQKNGSTEKFRAQKTRVSNKR